MSKHPHLSKNEAKGILDKLARLLYDALVMKAPDLVAAVTRRAEHDSKQKAKWGRLMRRLSSAYNSYLDAQRHLEEHEKSQQKLTAFLGPLIVCPDEVETYEDVEELSRIENLRRSLELWEAVEQYLRFVSEAKVADILECLELVSIKTTRQAVEACIKSRPKVFVVSKRKREKFVSLRSP